MKSYFFPPRPMLSRAFLFRFWPIPCARRFSSRVLWETLWNLPVNFFSHFVSQKRSSPPEFRFVQISITSRSIYVDRLQYSTSTRLLNTFHAIGLAFHSWERNCYKVIIETQIAPQLASSQKTIFVFKSDSYHDCSCWSENDSNRR